METLLTDPTPKIREVIRLLLENPIAAITWSPDFLEKDKWCETMLGVGRGRPSPQEKSILLGWDNINNIRIAITFVKDLIGIVYDSPMKLNFRIFEKESPEEIHRFLCEGIENNWQLD